MKFSVGDVIKAYDFEPRLGEPEAYVIGKIDSVDFERDAFRVSVIEDTVFRKGFRRSMLVAFPGRARRDFENRVSFCEVA
jgi:hypothetical protein